MRVRAVSVFAVQRSVFLVGAIIDRPRDGKPVPYSWFTFPHPYAMINKRTVTVVQGVYFFLIILSIIGLALGVIYFYAHTKDKNPYYILSGIFCFLLPGFMTAGMLLNSEKLVLSAIFFPICFVVITTCIEMLIRYKNCTYCISAKCVSFRTTGRNNMYGPQFSFCHNGKAVLAYSFITYSKRKFKSNFEIDQTYDIFINPEKPNYCVDKRLFPWDTIVWLICSVLFLIVGTVIVIAI